MDTREGTDPAVAAAAEAAGGNFLFRFRWKKLIRIVMDTREGTDPAEAAGAPLDFTTQTRNANGADWQAEVYQKIKSMREMYLSELNDLYWKTASEMQQHPQHEKIEKLKIFKMTLERIVLFLRLNKREIQLSHKEKLFSLEKYITFFLSGKSPHNPTSSPLHGKLP
ncbi:hypothetical protein KY285_022069 [Solanum tuberosum]|nr:hypothetical protein KY285_022069 [Solanum tuberosum]